MFIFFIKMDTYRLYVHLLDIFRLYVQILLNYGHVCKTCPEKVTFSISCSFKIKKMNMFYANQPVK